EEFEESMLAARTAKAAVQRFQARMKDRIIRAPFSGIVGLRQLSRGALVRPGDIVTTVDDISKIKVDFTVPASLLASIRVGQKVEATSSSYSETFFGEVVSISSRIDETSRAVTLRSVIDNDATKLRAGMLV